MFRLSWARCLAVAAVVTVSFSMLFFTNDLYGRMTRHVYTPWQAWSVFATQTEKDLAILMPQLWNTSMHSLDNPTFIADSGEKFEIKPDAHHWESQGKKILIIDVDSRLDLDRGAILNTDNLDQQTMKGRTGGILNHMLYSLVHGYDYRLIRAPEFNDRHGTWVKVSMMRQALKTHDIVIFLDSDAVFEYVHLPFEWLMSMWNITSETLLAIAEDPYSKKNSDANGKVMWNTGFMVAQKSDKTEELFKRWDECPTPDSSYGDNCTQWGYDWAHEQAALANNVRYDYEEGTDIRVIPCNEGNGMPGPHGGPHCNGVFIRHFWFGKVSTVKELYDLLSVQMVRSLHRFFHRHIDEFYVDASTYEYPLGDDPVI